VNNCMAHVSWTAHATCQWNGQTHVLSVMNAVARVAQRRYVGFRLSWDQECVRIGPEHSRAGLDTCQL
jgi:hypothetical protein